MKIYEKIGEENYPDFLRHIQFINDISDVLHVSSSYNSDLQNLIKNVLSVYPYGNKTIIIS